MMQPKIRTETRYDHLGKVLAAKARLAATRREQCVGEAVRLSTGGTRHG